MDTQGNDDVGSYIHVKVTYSVGTIDDPDSVKTAEAMALVSQYRVQPGLGESNTLPEFDPTTVSRSVDEGKKSRDVGNPVTATDADRGTVLNYTLSTAENATPQDKTTADGGVDAFKIGPGHRPDNHQCRPGLRDHQR